MSNYQTGYTAPNVDYERMRAEEAERQRRAEEARLEEKRRQREEEERQEQERRRREQAALGQAVADVRASTRALEADYAAAYELEERAATLREQRREAEGYAAWVVKRSDAARQAAKESLQGVEGRLGQVAQALERAAAESQANHARALAAATVRAEAATRSVAQERAADEQEAAAVERARTRALSEAGEFLREVPQEEAADLAVSWNAARNAINRAAALTGSEGLAPALAARESARQLVIEAADHRGKLAGFRAAVAFEVAELERQLDESNPKGEGGQRGFDPRVHEVLSQRLDMVAAQAAQTTRYGDLSSARADARAKLRALRDHVGHFCTIARNLPELEKRRNAAVGALIESLDRTFGGEFDIADGTELPQDARRLGPMHIVLRNGPLGRTCDAWLSLDGTTQLHHHAVGETKAACVEAAARVRAHAVGSFVEPEVLEIAHGAPARPAPVSDATPYARAEPARGRAR